MILLLCLVLIRNAQEVMCTVQTKILSPSASFTCSDVLGNPAMMFGKHKKSYKTCRRNLKYDEQKSILRVYGMAAPNTAMSKFLGATDENLVM